MNENLMCVFSEMSQDEMLVIDGGEWEDFFEAVNPLNVVQFVYELGEDFGRATVKCGEALYDFGKDVVTIITGGK